VFKLFLLFRSKVELDEERVRSLKEKDELKRQLEDLVAVERAQVVKTAATDQVSNLLNFFSSLMIRMNNLEVLSQRTYSGWSNI